MPRSKLGEPGWELILGLPPQIFLQTSIHPHIIQATVPFLPDFLKPYMANQFRFCSESHPDLLRHCQAIGPWCISLWHFSCSITSLPTFLSTLGTVVGHWNQLLGSEKKEGEENEWSTCESLMEE